MLNTWVVALTFLAADDARDKAVKDQVEALQGTWVVVHAERNGFFIDQLKGAKLVVEGEKLTRVEVRGGKESKEDGGSFKIDPSAKPKSIDLIGWVEGHTTPGIYELDRDTLKICVGSSERPKEFVTGTNSDRSLMVLRRGKP